jgi:hypothetical protein
VEKKRGDAEQERRDPKKAAEEQVTTANEAAISMSGVYRYLKRKETQFDVIFQSSDFASSFPAFLIFRVSTGYCG